MSSRYRSTALRELRDQQVRFVPREKKIEQVDRAEALFNEIEDDRTYSYEYLCHKITNYRPHEHLEVVFKGTEVRSDILAFIEDMSDSADLPAEVIAEKVFTIEDLSRHFNVATKTISRWRKQGLVSRRLLFNGRKRVGFLSSSVSRFVENNPTKIQRGAKFSQLTEEERYEVVAEAREMAADIGQRPTEIARRIAKRLERSVETIRYTLKHFDQEHPDLAIFPSAGKVLSSDAKMRLYRDFRRGVPIEDLSTRYSRTKSSVYRIVAEIRAKRILELPLDFIPSPEFEEFRPFSEEARILGPPPVSEIPKRTQRLPEGLPAYLAQLYDIPLLTREQEVHLFRKMNYLKYKAANLRDELEEEHPRPSLMNKTEQLYDEAVATKNSIVAANLRLVVSIAKRHINRTENFFELVSDGNMSLIRAVEKFDYMRGNKFSTYASWAIIKNYARSIPDELRRRDRFRTTDVDLFESKVDGRTDQYEQETAQLERESQVEKILHRLDVREQHIIVSRFGLAPGSQPQTLKEVGLEMGVTKERIRQIEARALNKLRDAAAEEKIDIPGL